MQLKIEETLGSLSYRLRDTFTHGEPKLIVYNRHRKIYVRWVNQGDEIELTALACREAYRLSPIVAHVFAREVSERMKHYALDLPGFCRVEDAYLMETMT